MTISERLNLELNNRARTADEFLPMNENRRSLFIAAVVDMNWFRHSEYRIKYELARKRFILNRDLRIPG